MRFSTVICNGVTGSSTVPRALTAGEYVQDVHGAEALLDLREGGDQGGAVHDICGETGGVDALRAQLGGQGIKVLPRAGEQGDLETLLSEDAGTDAGTRASADADAGER